MTHAASFEIHFHQFLNAQGEAVGDELPKFAQDLDTLKELYRMMVLTRTFDNKAVALQRTGQLGTYAACLGQEAIGAGMGSVLQADDVLVPTYREQATQFAHGVTMVELLQYWGGDERGSDYKAAREDFPVCIPIATQACHAVGIATAFKLRQQQRAVVCMSGDGATSKGDFYEALNLAGAWRLPVVFLVSNNQWAISVPRKAQSAAETLAQKAIAAGFEGMQVDGNDVIAVRWASELALEKARSGKGPTLIEALTYRMHDHTTADDASRYRSDEELSEHWKADPVARARNYLVAAKAWGKEDEEALVANCSEQVQAAVDAYLAISPEPPEAMFAHLYETLPKTLEKQMAAMLAAAGGNDG